MTYKENMLSSRSAVIMPQNLVSDELMMDVEKKSKNEHGSDDSS
jgi:hypothetical protein